MVRQTVTKIKDAEERAERLMKDAETKARELVIGFQNEHELRFKTAEEENRALHLSLLAQAEKSALAEEKKILDEAQEEMNAIRASADKKREKAVTFIFQKILNP